MVMNIQYAFDTAGTKANSSARMVVITPCVARMFTWTPAGLVFWKKGGK